MAHVQAHAALLGRLVTPALLLPASTVLGQRYPATSGEEEAACAACAGCYAVLFLAVAIAAMHVALLVWVARDAKARGMEGAVWVAIIFFTGLIGLIVYVLSRPEGNLVPCRACGNKRLQASALCPHCGHS